MMTKKLEIGSSIVIKEITEEGYSTCKDVGIDPSLARKYLKARKEIEEILNSTEKNPKKISAKIIGTAGRLVFKAEITQNKPNANEANSKIVLLTKREFYLT